MRIVRIDRRTTRPQASDPRDSAQTGWMDLIRKPKEIACLRQPQTSYEVGCRDERTPNNQRKTTRRMGALSLLALLPLLAATAGCFSVKIKPVEKTVVLDKAMTIPLEQLLRKIKADYDGVQTLNATIDITATTGGAHQGEVKEIPSFAGYIFLRKPSDLRVLLLVPIVRSRALDMVSDGKDFKLLIPPKNRAVVGPDAVTTPSTKGFENLRPNIIRDALQIPPVAADEYVALSESSRILPSPTRKHESIEEPDYDLTVLGLKSDHVLERRRVVHIDRIKLRPYQQDIYDPSGRLVTVVNYSNYQTTNGTDFPMVIDIRRPIDEYTLRIAVTKLVLNEKLDDEQFVLKIPDGMPVQKM